MSPERINRRPVITDVTDLPILPILTAKGLEKHSTALGSCEAIRSHQLFSFSLISRISLTNAQGTTADTQGGT